MRSAPICSTPSRANAVLHDTVSACFSVIDSGQFTPLELRITNELVCGGWYASPPCRTVDGFMLRFIMAAAEVTTLNVEPGGNVSENARFRSGLFSSLSSAL